MLFRAAVQGVEDALLRLQEIVDRAVFNFPVCVPDSQLAGGDGASDGFEVLGGESHVSAVCGERAPSGFFGNENSRARPYNQTTVNVAEIKDSLANLHRCLDKITDEMEVRPGEKTIRGTDGGTIDVAEVLKAVEVARADLRDIEGELTP
jgi:hypothetical protein